MCLAPWLQNRASHRAARGRAQRRPAPLRFRPRREALDDRYLPSTLTVQ
jgi:hypothetical protein